MEIKKARLETLADTLGKDILRLLNDDNVFEIMLNSDGKLWVDTFDSGFVNTEIKIDASQGKRIIYCVPAMADTQ